MPDQQVRRGLPRPGQPAEPVVDAPAPAAATVPPSAPATPPGRRAGLPTTTAAAAAPTVAPTTTAGPQVAARPSARPSRTPSRRVVVGVLVALVVAVIAVLAARGFLLGTQAGRDFLVTYPGTTPLPSWVPVGIPAWLEWQHFLNAFFLVLIIRTGWMVHTGRRPSASWSRRKPRAGSTKIAIELWTHLSLDLFWLANGLVFSVLLFVTGQWARIIPTSWAAVPNAVSAALQYLSLHWPTEDGWVNYNSLQLFAYGVTVFVAAPLAVLTGIRMSPLWPARNARLSKAYPVGLARALHFPVMLYFVAFVIVHVGLVLSTGALANLNHMYGRQDAVNWWGAGVFAVSLVVTVGGWLALRPPIMQQAGALFGKVGR